MWFFALAVIDCLFFLLRGIRILRARIITRVLIGLSCLFAGIVLFPRPAPETAIQLSAASIIIIATLYMLSEIFLIIFYKIKRVFRKKDLPVSLPEHLMEVCRAMEILAARRVGALIILRQLDMLEGYMDKGIPFDAQINAEALVALFSPGSPMHDGAALISTGRIKRVKSIISLKTNTALPMGIGTRHRSAVGITEKTDAIALVVSEERGEMSIAYRGNLIKAASLKHLQSLLARALKGKNLLLQQPTQKP
ncbi:MAG: DNA integrity scanning protein DisA nucleotide-binding domain protein [Candidatus Omnitrophota bacterium]